MASTIKPFNATYYNPSLAGEYSSLVCPPYDVISKPQLNVLRNKSLHNFAHVLIVDDNVYQKAAKTLNSWIDEGILVDDGGESLYLYEQNFKVEKEVFKRFGILSLLRMDKKEIFPHEYTHEAPKEDRKRIITSTEANLSPIFVIASRHLEALEKIYLTYTGKEPFCSFEDSGGVTNRVWKISNPEEIAQICQEVENCKLVIADGHHRFETSFDYFRNNKDKFKDLNYIMAFIAGHQDGLRILPTHRIVKINDSEELFLNKLERDFSIEKVSQESLEEKLKPEGEFCLGIYRNEKLFFLRLKSRGILDKIPNEVYRKLDTYVFHSLVLPLFETESDIEYTHSIEEAKDLASREKTAFILRPANLESVFKISSKGFRMPQKSTYFYPKLLSGIVIRRFKT